MRCRDAGRLLPLDLVDMIEVDRAMLRVDGAVLVVGVDGGPCVKEVGDHVFKSSEAGVVEGRAAVGVVGRVDGLGALGWSSNSQSSSLSLMDSF